MLSLVKKRFRRGQQHAAIPDGQRAYTIGDVHGRLDLLNRLIEMILEDDRRRRQSDTMVIFLGDLINRGPDSARVIDRAMELARTVEVRFVMGNHEEVFLAMLERDEKALKLFCRIGGRETILSYGLPEAIYRQSDYDELSAAIEALVPLSHRDFIAAFEDMITLGDYLFVHAGIRPGVPLHQQQQGDLRWIRGAFVDCDDDFGPIVVHGHTISDKVSWRHNRIGIDTGAFASNKLTALGLEGTDRWLLQTGRADG